MSNNLRCGRGFSVIELLVGFALFAALVVAVAEGMRLYIATNKHVKVQEQVLDVRANLRGRLNCEKTLAPILAASQCDGSQYVNVKDGNNAVIVLANGSAKIGDYKIRSRCQKLGGFYGIVSDYLRVGPTGDAVKDPLKGTVTDWKQMSKVPIACLPQADCSPTEEGRSVLLNGSGTAADPFRICTFAHLNEVRGNVTAYYKVMKDIDASSTLTSPWAPIPFFSGSIEGNNKVIDKLSANRPTETNVAFLVGLRGSVSNLKLTNVTIAAQGNAAGLAAQAGTGANIANVTVSGQVVVKDTKIFSWHQAGLIVGTGTAIISKCVAQGTVSVEVNNGGWPLAGLIGGYLGGSLADCTTSGTVLVKNISGGVNAYGGGAVGMVGPSSLSILNLNSSGSVLVQNDGTGGRGVAGGNLGHCTGASLKNVVSAVNVSAISPNDLAWTIAGGNCGQGIATRFENLSSSAPVSVISAKHWAIAGGNQGYLGPLTVVNMTSTSSVNALMSGDGYAIAGGNFGRVDGGRVDGGTYTSVHGLGDVIANSTGGGSSVSGGLAGVLSDVTLLKSHSQGKVNGALAGGLVGQMLGVATTPPSCIIQDSWTQSKVYAAVGGGLVGSLRGANATSNCSILRSFATGDVTGGDTGALLGNAYWMQVKDSFATGKTTAINPATAPNKNSIGGLIGRVGVSGGAIVQNSYFFQRPTPTRSCDGTNLITTCTAVTDIKDFYKAPTTVPPKSPYQQWDFSNVWIFPSTPGFPVHR